MTKSMGKRSGFEYLMDDEYNWVDWYYTVDMPLGKPQLTILWNQLTEMSANDKQLKDILSYAELRHDGHGSFLFRFNPQIWGLGEKLLAEWNETLASHIHSTDWIYEYQNYTSVNEYGVDEYIEANQYEIEELFNHYVDSQLAMGYGVGEDNLREMFNNPWNTNRVTDDTIRKWLLPYMLKGAEISLCPEEEVA